MEISKKQLRGLSPDDSDRKNIVEFIKTYDITFPYPHPESLQLAIEEGLQEVEQNVGTIRTTKTNDGGITKRWSLPQPFVMGLKKAYPLIFSDKTQSDWFAKNFPNLTLDRR